MMRDGIGIVKASTHFATGLVANILYVRYVHVCRVYVCEDYSALCSYDLSRPAPGHGCQLRL